MQCDAIYFIRVQYNLMRQIASIMPADTRESFRLVISTLREASQPTYIICEDKLTKACLLAFKLSIHSIKVIHVSPTFQFEKKKNFE